MPASSVDTFFACSLMVILIVAAMAGTAKIAQPYLNDLSNMNSVERYRGLADCLLLSTGDPSSWGKLTDDIPTVFGLASETQEPYELDLDKISRLNRYNIYSIAYPEIWTTLETRDISLNIKIHPLFDVSVNLASSQSGEGETTYTFQVSTLKSGFPISTWLQCYVIVETYVDGISSSTASSGSGIVNATLPNSLNGTALLVVFAKAKANSQIISFTSYSFSHNSETPEPNRTFLQLSPLNHVLNVTFQYQSVEVSNAYVFTYNYHFNLSQSGSGNQTLEYTIPQLLDPCPMILVLNGNETSKPFAEWTAYPQLPLETGADFNESTTRSSVVAVTYIVRINSVLYEFVITVRGVQDTNG